MTLIGPKPDVDVPDLPIPWTSDGDAILDANGRYVLAVNPGITHLDRHEIAAAVADSINRDHEPTTDVEDDDNWRDVAAMWKQNAENASQMLHAERQRTKEAEQERDQARAERDRVAAWHDPNDRPDIETPAGPVRSANEVETCETCEGTGRNCWAHGGEADAWRGGGVIADAVTVDADDLEHTKPSSIVRASQGLEPFPDPLAHVVPGDPDSTNDTNIWCGSKNPLGGARVCHREAGHVGQHIAANGSRVVAVWRDDA